MNCIKFSQKYGKVEKFNGNCLPLKLTAASDLVTSEESLVGRNGENTILNYLASFTEMVDEIIKKKYCLSYFYKHFL